MLAKESFEIATKFTYQDGALRGTAKGQRKDYREVVDASVLLEGYTLTGKRIADRRMILEAYRFADVLERVTRTLQQFNQ